MMIRKIFTIECVLCLFLMLFSSLIHMEEKQNFEGLKKMVAACSDHEMMSEMATEKFANRWVDEEYEIICEMCDDIAESSLILAVSFFYYLEKKMFIHDAREELVQLLGKPEEYMRKNLESEPELIRNLAKQFERYDALRFGGMDINGTDISLPLLSDQYRYKGESAYDETQLFRYAEKTWDLIAESLGTTKVPHQCTQYAAGIFRMIYGFAPTIKDGKDMTSCLLQQHSDLFAKDGDLKPGTMFSIDASDAVEMSEVLRQYGHVGMILGIEYDATGEIAYLDIYDGNILNGGVRNGYRWNYNDFLAHYKNCKITYAIPKEKADTKKELNILMIGNSYTSHGSDKSVPTLLEQLAEMNGHQIECDVLKKGGAGFEDFATRYFADVRRALRKDTQYDIIFLQGNGTEKTMAIATEKLLKEIRKDQPQAEVWLYCTQPAKNPDWRNNNKRYRRTAVKYGLKVAYASDLASECRVSCKDVRLRTSFEEDRNHPTWAGYYVAACAIYHKLCGPIRVVEKSLKGCDLGYEELKKIASLANEM